MAGTDDLATLDELKGRLDWTLDADEERAATGALEDLSDEARYHARRSDWDQTTAPRMARRLVLKAAQRFIENPNGYTQSRAGDETLAWNDSQGSNAGTAHFTDAEQLILIQLGGRKPILASVPIQAWGRGRADVEGRVPVDYGGESFPFLNAEPPTIQTEIW
jgi:hypothetical protein